MTWCKEHCRALVLKYNNRRHLENNTLAPASSQAFFFIAKFIWKALWVGCHILLAPSSGYGQSCLSSLPPTPPPSDKLQSSTDDWTLFIVFPPNLVSCSSLKAKGAAQLGWKDGRGSGQTCCNNNNNIHHQCLWSTSFMADFILSVFYNHFIQSSHDSMRQILISSLS